MSLWVGPCTIESCENYGEVICDKDWAGGICGVSKSDGTGLNRICNVKNFGKVHGVNIISCSRRNNRRYK